MYPSSYLARAKAQRRCKPSCCHAKNQTVNIFPITVIGNRRDRVIPPPVQVETPITTFFLGAGGLFPSPIPPPGGFATQLIFLRPLIIPFFTRYDVSVGLFNAFVQAVDTVPVGTLVFATVRLVTSNGLTFVIPNFESPAQIEIDDFGRRRAVFPFTGFAVNLPLVPGTVLDVFLDVRLGDSGEITDIGLEPQDQSFLVLGPN